MRSCCACGGSGRPGCDGDVFGDDASILPLEAADPVDDVML